MDEQIKEEWKEIPRFPDYAVSSVGRIMRLTYAYRSRTYPGKIIKAHPNRAGYVKVTLCRKKKHYQRDVHRIVTETFLGPCPEGHEVNHKNGNKSDNAVANLEYLTRSQNHKHAYATGLMHRGSKHWKAKLSESDIFTILELNREGWGQSKIAHQFKVTREAIKDILVGNNWSWLTGIKKEVF